MPHSTCPAEQKNISDVLLDVIIVFFLRTNPSKNLYEVFSIIYGSPVHSCADHGT